MKIVFLDIDGVLNCEGSRSHCVGYRGIDDKRVENLAKIIKATGRGNRTYFHLERGLA